MSPQQIIFLCLCFYLGPLLVAAESAPNKVQNEVLESAKAALEQQNGEAALEHLQRWTGTQHSLQQLFIGHAYRILEKPQDAAIAFKTCLILDPQLKAAAMGLIDIYSSTAQWRELRPLLEQWINLDQDTLPLIKLMIYCAKELQDLRWADALMQRALLRFPSDQELRLLDIGLLIEAQRWDEAEQAIQQSLRLNPQEIRLWQYLAYIYQSLEKPQLALAASEAALLLEPTNAALRQDFAQAQLAAGNFAEAYQQFMLLVQKDGTDNKLLQAAAQAAFAAKAYSQAQQWIEKIDQAYREQHLTHLALRVLADSKQYDKLDQAADGFLARNVLDMQTLLWLAQIAESRSQAGRAEMLYQMVRKSDAAKEAALASLYLARLWYSQGRKQVAQDMVRDYVKQNPQDDYARRLLGLMQ